MTKITNGDCTRPRSCVITITFFANPQRNNSPEMWELKEA